MSDASEGKLPWESKTIVLNALLGLIGALALFFPPAHVVADWINANGVIIATGWGVLNVILRFITKDAILLIG